jgi:hypothetical protein
VRDTVEAMSECLVDLSYRGLSLGQRIKLTRVEAASGYLEMPAPMPVGTSIAIATDDGLTLDAIVTEVHEQAGGATVAPGMQVAPKLAGDATAWWSAHLDAAPEPATEAPTVEIAESMTAVPQALPEAEVRTSGTYAIVDDGMRTIAMSAIDPAALGMVVPPEEEPDDKKPSGGAKKRRTNRRGS